MSTSLPCPSPLGATTRHGRAADAFIATYVRELLAEHEPEQAPGDAARAEPGMAPLAPSTDETAADATL